MANTIKITKTVSLIFITKFVKQILKVKF